MTYNIVLASGYSLVIQFFVDYKHKVYYNIIDYIPCSRHYILVTYLFITGNLYLLVPFTFFTHSSTLPSGNSLFSVSLSLFLAIFLFFRFLIWVKIYKYIPNKSEKKYSFLSLSDLFHLAKTPLNLSTLSQMASFLWLNNITLYI